MYILYTNSINVCVFGSQNIVMSVKKSLKNCDQERLKEKENKTIIYGPLRFREGYWDDCIRK